ncbi:hypothetical protein V5O48_005548 [Marasmius crinis-equi]|uniref:Uncharacterized protein n=1 Tax=Marasmius crinis-equi TaxID=585013 RepID=A0ABR3FM10_9AGAR
MHIYLDHKEHALQPIKLSLSHLKGYPLMLTVVDNIHHEDPRPEYWEEFCHMFTEQCHCWHQVDFVEVQLLVSYMVDNPLEHTPLLEVVAYNLFEHCFINTPKLTSVNFDWGEDVPEPIMGMENIFPWSTMRHLQLDYDTQATLAGIFKALQIGVDLESLKCTGCTMMWTHGTWWPYKARNHRWAKDKDCLETNLSSLTIDMWDCQGFYEIVHDLFRSLVLPSLDSLDISCLQGQFLDTTHFLGVWPWDVLRECFKQSGCNLTTLTLGGLPLSECDVLSLLELCPSIHTFTLHEVSIKKCPEQVPQTITKSLVKRLQGSTPSENVFSVQDPVLTKLTYLRLKARPHFDTDEEFVEFVKSRWFVSGYDGACVMERLRTVELHVEKWKLPEKTYKSLKWINSDGMMISVFGDEERVV